MKRIVAAFIALLILFVFVTYAFSAEIDGIDSGIEWENSTAYVLIEGDSNCGVESGIVKVKFDAQNSCVYLCFMFNDPMLEQGNLSAGISFSVENSEPFVMTMAFSPQNVDIDKYNILGAMSVNEDNGMVCEVRIGIKAGLPKTLDVNVRFIDASGEPSNYYPFTLINEAYVETTKMEVSPTKDNYDPAYNPDLLTQRVTKDQTVKPKTTRKKRTTSKATERTTRWTVPDSPYSYTGRTKREEKVSDRPLTVIVPAVTVYYYEKEVIISHVYINEPNALSELTVNEVTVAVTSLNSTVPQTADVTNFPSVSEGGKYKLILGIGACIAFAVIAFLGVSGIKKGSSKDCDE